MMRTEEELLKEYYHDLSAEAEEVAELKLNAAVRKGVTSRRRDSFSLKNRYTLTTAAILAIVLVFSIPWAGGMLEKREAVQGAAVTRSAGEFDAYRQQAGSNITVSSAIEAGLIQRISGVTAEHDGYVLTVDGVAADQKGIIILYSMKNNTKANTNWNLLTLTESRLRPVSTWRGEGSEIAPGRTTYGYEVMEWEKDYSSLPDQVTLAMELHEFRGNTLSTDDSLQAKLSVAIPLDRNHMAKVGETIRLDKTLAIGGQEINIKEAYVAPSGIYLDYTVNPKNSKQIFSLYNPHVLVGSGGEYTNLKLLGISEGKDKTRLVFANDSGTKESVQLNIGGVLALDKNATRLVIDTDKQKVIQGPGPNLKISTHTTAKDATLVLEYHPEQGAQKIYNSITNSLKLDTKFTDGTGKLHESATSFAIPPLTESMQKANLYFVGLGSNNYPQPLTFTIESYPNLIKERLSLQIR
ncbi:DUF4179 domain-containing protein [Paenibacillus sp. FSL K6-1096]|uniref:DUF4179 domain-containing protein n=1 Tax=Paenibacillus sp. FSL K6-1096 TaxID=2921460 RepID=UPI0030EB1615